MTNLDSGLKSGKAGENLQQSGENVLESGNNVHSNTQIDISYTARDNISTISYCCPLYSGTATIAQQEITFLTQLK